MEYNEIIDGTSESSELSKLNEQSSNLMIQIHALLDLKSTPIKNGVKVLGVTPSQARNLAKGDVDKFNIYELQTFLKRLQLGVP